MLHRRKFKWICMLLLHVVTFTLLTSFTAVFATTGKLQEDILNSNRFQGAIDSIHILTDFMDGGFIWFSTAIAYIMIIVSFSKNFLAGSYYMWPKFWDKVYAAHEAYDSKSFQEVYGGFFGKGFASRFGSLSRKTLGQFIMSKIPNIRAVVEAEGPADEPVPARDYWLKALPALLLGVMIAACIYNGYTKDVTVLVTNFGSEVFERVVLQTSPIELLDRLTSMSGTPDFSSANGMNLKDKVVYKIASDAYRDVITKYTDVSTPTAKANLVSNLEKMAYDWIGWVETNHAAQMDENKYDVISETSIVLDNNNTVGSATTDSTLWYANSDVAETATKYRTVFSAPISTLNLSTTKHLGENWVVKTVVTFIAVADKSEAQTKVVNDFELSVYAVFGADTVTLHLPSASSGTYVLSFKDAVISCGTATYKYKSSSSNAYTFKLSEGTALAAGSGSTTFDCTNLYYQSGPTNRSTVTKLNTSIDKNAFKLTSASGACNDITSYGDAPVIIVKSK